MMKHTKTTGVEVKGVAFRKKSELPQKDHSHISLPQKFLKTSNPYGGYYVDDADESLRLLNRYII